MTSTDSGHVTASAVAEDILSVLARFKVLTVGQMLDATGRDEKTLRNRLRQLVSANFVGCREFRLGKTSGRLPNAYWLAPKGVKWVRDSLNMAARMSRREKMAISQASHRAFIVDALIAADRWARETGQSRPMFRTCLEGGESRIELGSKTAIADAVVELDDTRGNRRVYVVEVYCDYAHNATSKPYEKLAPYVVAGVGNALDNSLGIPPDGKAALVLVICDDASMRDRLVGRLPGRPGMPPLALKVWQRFLFKSADEVGRFGEGWRRVDGSLITLPT